MNTLESLIKRQLGIDERLETQKVFYYIQKNDGKDLKVLPLVNFQDEKIYRMTDDKVTNGVRHTILFYKKKKWIFGRYYIIYCKREEGDYIKIYSNRKINKEIQHFEFLEEVDDNLFLISKNLKISFTPVSTEYYEKLNIVYRDIVFG